MSTQRQVLIVEDESSMQILLRHLLLRSGYVVTLASNGLEAKEILGKQRFDLICSDVMMSGIDGIQLCLWAKNNEQLRDIPFVILSSRAQQGENELGLQAGADAYLTKPFDVHDLLQTLQHFLPIEDDVSPPPQKTDDA